MINEKLGVLLVDVPEPRMWEYSYIGLYDYDKETEFYIDKSDLVSMVSQFGYKCTQEEAKKIPTVSMGIVGGIMTLREIRLKLGMTMDEMAEVINVPKSSYAYWESRNKAPEGAMQKIQKLYDDAMEHMDDGIDIVEKIGTIKRHYKMSYERLVQLVGAKNGSSIIHWMNDVKPRLKYMMIINELYYKIVSKKRNAKAGSKTTFCQINPLDKQSWKVKVENKVIVWK